MIYLSGKEGGTGDGTAVTFRRQVVNFAPPWFAQPLNSPYNYLVPPDGGYSYLDWLVKQNAERDRARSMMGGMPPMIMGDFGGMGGFHVGDNPFGLGNQFGGGLFGFWGDDDSGTA